MNKKELENRIKYLQEQVVQKKYILEKAVLDLENVCKELLDLEQKKSKLDVQDENRGS